MTVAVIVLTLLLIPSVVLNVYIMSKAVRLNETLLIGSESIEDALDEINDAYGTVGKILQSPLAANDPKIVQIHKELKRVHVKLLAVADRLVSSWNDDEDEDDASEE
jgi:biopolymer transport protein ExbB/TolQ